MRAGYQARRLADAFAAIGEARAVEARVRWPRERLEAHQQERLEAVVRHARENSPYYRELLPKGRSVRLDELPMLDKARLMDEFDRIVCDPRLRRDELLAWLERLDRDDVYLGRYRAMTTSGSSGRKGLFVYERSEWRPLLGVFFFLSSMLGAKPRLPKRRRMAAIMGAGPAHMSRQMSAGASIGVHNVLGLPVTLPLEQLVEELNRFQPEFLNAYPSVALRLADEAFAGRLRIRLVGMSTSSELRTPEMTRRLEEAFGVQPSNVYATTEGLIGVDCERHDGIHLMEDLALVENVDADNQPVPPGEPGARLLVTSLVKFVQPIIRLELPDVLVIDPEPCACGRTTIRARSIEGRSDDVILLPGAAGRDVRVDPAHFGVITRDRDVREFQVVQDGERLRVLVVASETVGDQLDERLREAVARRLAELGVSDPHVDVERRDSLPRSAGGKLQLVVAQH